MDVTFLHSGGCGDIIYSLPYVKMRGGGVMYIKPQNNYNNTMDNYEAMRHLLMAQEYITDVAPYPLTPVHELDPDIHIDHDLDEFRKAPNIAHHNLMMAYFHGTGVNFDPVPHRQPWLRAIGLYPAVIDREHSDNWSKPFALIHRTLRYQDQNLNWQRYLDNLKETYGNEVYFLGFEEEHVDFSGRWGAVRRLHTEDIMQMAQLIVACDSLWCNQSVALTLAQAMGKTYYLEVAPDHSNTIMKTPNETLLNR